LHAAAKAREKNPESSLMELAFMMEPPISKPSMNNRMKKLLQTAREANV
jgi:DNA-binding transcriptional regulator WhiA